MENAAVSPSSKCDILRECWLVDAPICALAIKPQVATRGSLVEATTCVDAHSEYGRKRGAGGEAQLLAAGARAVGPAQLRLSTCQHHLGGAKWCAQWCDYQIPDQIWQSSVRLQGPAAGVLQEHHHPRHSLHIRGASPHIREVCACVLECCPVCN